MRILIFGGTGAIGGPLTKLLGQDEGDDVFVVTRKTESVHAPNIRYLHGNANNLTFFENTVIQGYDVIVDFMIWSPAALQKRIDLLCKNCAHYIAMGTSSEYKGVDEAITEETPRLVDDYDAATRKSYDRYHIRKSATDDIIATSGFDNWTIVRPWVTFNERKHPLVTVPLGVWWWRYLNDMTIALPRGVMDKKCTLTYGGDVARAISKLMRNERAYCQVINIASESSQTWGELIALYQRILMELNGKQLKIALVDDDSAIWENITSQFDPIVNDRCYNRTFSMAKLRDICNSDDVVFGDLEEQLKAVFSTMLFDGSYSRPMPDPAYMGIMDQLTGEHTPSDFCSSKRQLVKFEAFQSPVGVSLVKMYRTSKKTASLVGNKASGFVNNRVLRRHTAYDVETSIRLRWSPEYKRIRLGRLDEMRKRIRAIKENQTGDRKIRIVFICQFHSAWNSCSSAFQAALQDPDLEVILLALPEKVAQKGSKNVSSVIEDVYEEGNLAYEYCKDFFSETMNGYDSESGEWVNLRELKPDYVVMNRSNQNYLPSQYRSSTISAYTKVVHIPYAYCKMLWDSRSVYRDILTDYTHIVFTENRMYQEMLRKIYHDMLGAKEKRIEYVGFPRFDLYPPVFERPQRTPKTVLWLPRWVTASRLEASTFFKFKDVLTIFFEEHPEFNLICRPHPKMFGNFLATGEMTEDEVRDFKELFNNRENFELDERGDYLPSFEKADVFVSDTSSLLVEEFITGKPIVFCGIKSHFDRDAMNWAKYMYSCYNEDDLIEHLTALLNGIDPLEPERVKYIGSHMKHDGQCGRRIIEVIKDDFRS